MRHLCDLCLEMTRDGGPTSASSLDFLRACASTRDRATCLCYPWNSRNIRNRGPPARWSNPNQVSEKSRHTDDIPWYRQDLPICSSCNFNNLAPYGDLTLGSLKVLLPNFGLGHWNKWIVDESLTVEDNLSKKPCWSAGKYWKFCRLRPRALSRLGFSITEPLPRKRFWSNLSSASGHRPQRIMESSSKNS